MSQKLLLSGCSNLKLTTAWLQLIFKNSFVTITTLWKFFLRKVDEHWKLSFTFLNQASTWFEKCVSVPIYLCLFVHSYIATHVSKFLVCIHKIKVGFFFESKNQVWQLTTDFVSGFPSWLFWQYTTEKHWSVLIRLTGNAYFIIWKVGLTCTYAKENEELPGGFAGRIFEEKYDKKTINRYLWLDLRKGVFHTHPLSWVWRIITLCWYMISA